mmetsp:Transcript_6912/g.24943  ORF Transcript_6912/g.24943 Transcript_6912/m.24943 type:complete len:370 (+) Transcript_6912:1295-2404(+)
MLRGCHSYSNTIELLDFDFFMPELSLAFSTISANFELGLLSRVSGESNSATSPPSRSRILSESMIVLSLWAIVSTVQSLKAILMVFWIRVSVSPSTLLVASSRIRILDLRIRALAMQSSCFWPTERLPPPSSMLESKPFLSGSSWMVDFRPDSLSAFQISASPSVSLKGSRLLLTVPEKMTGSWGTSESLLLRSGSAVVAMSTSSMVMLPLSSSTILYSVIIMVDLPQPVLPHTPIFSPPPTVKVRPLSTCGRSGRYLTYTLSKTIFPLEGQELETSRVRCLFESPSDSWPSYSVSLSMLFMLTSSSVICLTIQVMSPVMFMAEVMARPDIPAEFAEAIAETKAHVKVMLDPRYSSRMESHLFELTRGQ